MEQRYRAFPYVEDGFAQGLCQNIRLEWKCFKVKTTLAYCLNVKNSPMEQHALRSVNNCLNTNIYSFLETACGQSSNP